MQFPFVEIERRYSEYFQRTPGQSKGMDGEDPLPSIGDLAIVAGLSRETLVRYRSRGFLSALQADRLAAGLSLHPMDLWPDEWEVHLDIGEPEL